MKTILKLEEVALLLLGCLAWSQTHVSWWIFAALFLTPDIGMLGYVVNARTGAFTYNLFHHKGIAVMLWLAGMQGDHLILQAAGIILFAHSSFDRALGYGLKFPDSFGHTHLG